MPPDPSASKSDFRAAEEIKAILDGREKLEQVRIIRWVTESLDLPAVVSMVASPIPDGAPAAPAAVVVSSTTHHPTKKDLRSWVQEKDPQSDMQFVAVVAYFFRFVAPEPERKQAITGADLQTAARLAQWKVFKDPTTPMNNAIKQGYLDRAGRGEYRLNAVGENLVTMTLPRTKEGTTGKRKSKTTKAGPRRKAKQKRAT